LPPAYHLVDGSDQFLGNNNMGAFGRYRHTLMLTESGTCRRVTPNRPAA
jgi:predicted deacetylase